MATKNGTRFNIMHVPPILHPACTPDGYTPSSVPFFVLNPYLLHKAHP